MIVTLTQSEALVAAIVAVLYEVQNLVLGRQDRYGADNRVAGLEAHFKGYRGEIAVAKATDRFWCGALGKLKARDVAGLQVRATQPNYGLTLHDNDKDDDVFILAWVSGLKVDLRGWARASEGKVRDENGKKIYWQPDGSLGKNWTAAYVLPAAKVRELPENFFRPNLRELLLAEMNEAGA